MVVTDFLFAVIVAFLMFLVFSRGFRRVGPFGGVLWFFVIVLLASWAGGVWIRPAGPVLWGVYWMPFLWIGLLVALLLAAATPPPPVGRPPETAEEKEAVAEAAVVGATLSAFFWIVLFFLVAAIATHYMTRTPG